MSGEAAALDRWPHSELPDDPAAWIFQTARNRAVDVIRRRGVHADKLRLLEREATPMTIDTDEIDEDLHEEMSSPEDDRLRLIFLVCHPALRPEAQVALTLRLLGGLTTAEVARLSPPRADDRPAPGARQAQDSGRRDPVPHASGPCPV